MRKQKIKSEEEKEKKIKFLMSLGFSFEESNKMRLKVSSCNSYLYWMYKDNLTEVEAKNKVSELQKIKSPRCVEYWISKGFNLEESKVKVSNYQDNVSLKVDEDVEKYKKRCENRKNNKEKYILLYGEEIGFKKWEDKKKRSKITIENLIRIYGEEIGMSKWEQYINRQKTSQSEEKLMQKHGYEKAINIINNRKNLSKLCVEKFQTTGDFKYLNNNYSKSSQKLFWSIYNNLPDHLKEKCYFKELNHEYVLISDSGTCYLFDFVISGINLCIEFNGDFWHANPNKYKPDDFIFEKRASDIWKNDETKIQTLKSKRNIDTIIVWESDWANNKKETEKNLTNIIISKH